MTVEQSLDTALKANATLTAIVGQRIYWIKAEQLITVPYVVYTIVSDSDEQFAFGNTNTGHALVQFDVVGDQPSHKSALYAIRTLLRNTKTIGTLTVHSVLPSQIRERFDITTNRYVFSIDMFITFTY